MPWSRVGEACCAARSSGEVFDPGFLPARVQERQLALPGVTLILVCPRRKVAWSPEKSGDIMAIPEIDISGFFRGDAVAAARIYDQVNDALREIGFFTIVGHGQTRASSRYFPRQRKPSSTCRSPTNSASESRATASVAATSESGRRISGGRRSVGPSSTSRSNWRAAVSTSPTRRTTGNHSAGRRSSQTSFPTCRRVSAA